MAKGQAKTLGETVIKIMPVRAITRQHQLFEQRQGKSAIQRTKVQKIASIDGSKDFAGSFG